MASHAPQTILFVTNDGLVMDSGYSTRLAKGQFGIVDKGATPTALGMQVVNSFSGLPKDRLFEMKLGIAPLTPTRSQSNKSYSSVPFKLSEVVEITAHSPKKGIEVDEIIIGYDGFDANTAITLNNGDNEVINICLKGEAIGMLGYPNAEVTVKLYLEAPNTGAFTMHEIVEKAVIRLKDYKLVGNVPITEYIDITPVNSNNPAVIGGVPQAIFKLEVADNGNYSALGHIQAQYPAFIVVRESYVPGTATAGISTYVIIARDGAAGIPDYVVNPGDVYADCEECPENYELNTESGLCEYTGEPISISWKNSGVCELVQETYTIQLKDDECGVNKLAQLQETYPGLSVEVIESAACQTKYSAIVTSDIVCENCAPELRDLFVTEAPAPFEFIHWVKAPKVYDANALMGIYLKGKANILAGSEEYRDDLPFVYSSTRITVANEAPGMVNESFKIGNNGRFNVKVLNIATEPESIGLALHDLEERTRVYYENRQRLAGNNYGKWVLGQDSHLKPLSHYVTYSVRVRTNRFAQSFSGEVVENFDYIIAAEVGKHAGVEAILAQLAADAGIPFVPASF